jgi:hypothetical protein
VGIAFHSAEGTSDDGRVAWRSVSRLKQRWQSPGLIDLVHSHRPIDQPSTCLAMCSCPDLSRRSERRLHSLVRRICPCGRFDQFEERTRPVGSGGVNDHRDNWRLGHRRGRIPPRAHGGLALAMIGVRRPDLVVARARREINVAGFAFRSSAWWLLLQSQLTAGHHRSRRDGLTAEAPHKKRNP